MIKDIADLNIGDTIVITIVTKVIEKGDGFGDEPAYINTSFTYTDGSCIGLSNEDIAFNNISILAEA